MIPAGNPDGTANPHYVDHVVATAAARGIEATDHIVASNGMKLVAKGARIDPGMRERLLQHKLAQPLENCVSVVDAVSDEKLRGVAAGLLEQHALLRALCADDRARQVPESLASLRLSTPLRSLLSVYAESQPDRLHHGVGAAMLALALARRLRPGEIDRHRALAVAGLLHDVGELYIDPVYLQRETKLGPEQWRHIAAHPVAGHRVLGGMAGAGRVVADAVLLHHERLDGFGYPRGVADAQFTLDGQIVAIAEWLMALHESGFVPLARAGLAPRLMPGEFDDALLDAVAQAARSSHEVTAETVAPVSVDDALPQIERIGATLARHREMLPWIDERIAQAGPALRALLEAGQRRVLRVHASFSSMGFDAMHPAVLIAELAALNDAQVHVELASQLRELQWRMREMHRQTLLRAWLLPPADADVVRELMARLLPDLPFRQPTP